MLFWKCGGMFWPRLPKYLGADCFFLNRSVGLCLCELGMNGGRKIW